MIAKDYKKPGEYPSDDWYRTEDTNPSEPPMDWSVVDLVDWVYGKWVDGPYTIDVHRSDLESVQFSKVHKPIPHGTKLQFKIIDNVEDSPGKLKYTYDGLYDTYNSASIVQGVGILYIPDKIIVHASLK